MNYPPAYPNSSVLLAIISAECNASILLYAVMNDTLTRVLADNVDNSESHPMSYEPSRLLLELSSSTLSILIASEACT